MPVFAERDLGLLAGLADVLKTARLAVWTAGDAHCSSVVNETVTKSIAFFRRNYLPQLFFHLGWFLDVVYEAN